MHQKELFDFICKDDRGCWNWLRATRKGYGVAYILGRQVLAHRAAFESVNGAIPRGMCVCHSCDNPSCINPDHLWLGSHGENMKDMRAKERGTAPPIHSGENHWRSKCPEKVRHGESVPSSKMSEAQVRSLRDDYLSGISRDDIAAKYGLSRDSVPDFTSGRSWPHLLRDGELDRLKAEAFKRTRNNTKLTAETVAEIRKRLASGEQGKDLAVEYGMHKATISDIKLRKIWP